MGGARPRETSLWKDREGRWGRVSSLPPIHGGRCCTLKGPSPEQLTDLVSAHWCLPHRGGHTYLQPPSPAQPHWGCSAALTTGAGGAGGSISRVTVFQGLCLVAFWKVSAGSCSRASSPGQLTLPGPPLLGSDLTWMDASHGKNIYKVFIPDDPTQWGPRKDADSAPSGPACRLIQLLLEVGDSLAAGRGLPGLRPPPPEEQPPPWSIASR